MQKASYIQGLILLVVITLIWGTTFPLVEDAVRGISPAALIAVRFGMASVIFTPQLRSINSKLLKDGLLLGLLLFSSIATQAVALETIHANRAAFIASLSTILVPLLGLLLGQPLRPKTFLAAFLAFSGIGVMSWESGALVIGDLLMFCEAFVYSIYLLVLESATRHHPSQALTAIQLWVITLLGAFWVGPELVGQLEVIHNNLPAIIYLGVIGTAVNTWLQAIAQRSVSASEAALFYTLEPVFAAIFSFLLLGEKLGISGLIGGTFVLVAMVLSQTKVKDTQDDGKVDRCEPVVAVLTASDTQVVDLSVSILEPQKQYEN
ncbi:DMT family transporter [Scytonema hofmannii FACHB-248]|uniref:DMT family transporter n=1 Tax=Scytonema hofmannii FACHB-248 TaxID=1842502 RepID=A0ABR8GX79_9CYAN|nr:MULTISPECIES: DMT family transporter [Nostocales]MBD2608130.1 DMT family transporter [Scytonema hofmannii FACHB-248]